MVARATLPDGSVRNLRNIEVFDSYVKTWREAGYSFEWLDPRTVTIRRPL